MKWLALAVTLGLAARVDAKPKVEVCPKLEFAAPIVPFWEGEELWPACPLASPIMSIGGRCIDGTLTCMQPCSSTVEQDGKLTQESTYTYKTGRMVAVTEVSHFGPKPFETKEACKRDAKGHLVSCKSGDGDELKYTYAHAALAKVGERAFKRDKAGRLVTETWDDGTTTTFTYNADGTLATETQKSRGSVTTTYAYAKGHLAGVHTEPSDPSFGSTDITYDYDAAGRVTRETSQTGKHDAAPAGTTRIEPAGGEAITYAYDAKGRLVTQVRDLGGKKIVTTYRYECH